MKYRIQNINELNIDEIKKSVSKQRIERAAKFKFDVDRNRSIAVEYLLNEMISEYCDGVTTPVILVYDENGKPHVYKENGDEVEFSLSHSGDYVACIISDKKCGIDIEKHSNRDYSKIAKRICTEKELTKVCDEKAFYTLWTLKESVLKAVGLGLALDMRKVELCHDTNKEEYEAVIEGVTYIGKSLQAPEGYSLSYVEAM